MQTLYLKFIFTLRTTTLRCCRSTMSTLSKADAIRFITETMTFNFIFTKILSIFDGPPWAPQTSKMLFHNWRH